MDLLPPFLKELHAPAAICDRDGHIVDSNESFCHLFFFDTDNSAGVWLPSLISPESRDPLLSAVAGADGLGTVDVELRKAPRWVRLCLSSMPPGDSGGPVLAFGSDITDLRPDRIMELHSLERDFFRGERELFEEIRSIFDWRQEIKRRIYSSIMQQGLLHFSHALFQGNSLGGLMSLLSMILDGGAQTAQTQEYAPLLREYYTNALQTIDTLRRVSDLFGTHGSFRSLPASELAKLVFDTRDGMEEMLRIKGQRVLLSESVAPKDRTLRLDSKLFSAALGELLTNAMKYGPRACNILVLLFFSDEEFILKVVNPVEPDHRMAEDEFEKVFDPFYRHAKVIDERFAAEPYGYGLGLTAVRQIMDMHGASAFLVGLRQAVLTHSEQDVCATISMPYERKGVGSNPE